MFTEDLTAFFEPAGHAVSATFTPSGGDPSTVAGIFNDEYYDETGGMIDIEGSKPVFICAESDVSGVAQGDALVINSVDYTIRNCQPDGTGTITLILEKDD